MKWEEHKNKMMPEPQFLNRRLTDIECPKCGKKIWRREDIVLTSCPAQYQYECECGWIGYAYT